MANGLIERRHDEEEKIDVIILAEADGLNNGGEHQEGTLPEADGLNNDGETHDGILSKSDGLIKDDIARIEAASTTALRRFKEAQRNYSDASTNVAEAKQRILEIVGVSKDIKLNDFIEFVRNIAVITFKPPQTSEKVEATIENIVAYMETLKVNSLLEVMADLRVLNEDVEEAKLEMANSGAIFEELEKSLSAMKKLIG